MFDALFRGQNIAKQLEKITFFFKNGVMSYSNDLREKIIAFIENGNAITTAATTFGITRTTIYKWLKMKRLSGSLVDKPPKRSWKKVDPIRLIAFVKSSPDATLAEYAKHFGTSTVAIGRTLKKLKITRKKRLVFTESGMKPNVHYSWSK